MTDVNNKQIELYDQIQKIGKCMMALKDLVENIPEEDRYASVISIITERLEVEYSLLLPMALIAADTDKASNNGSSPNEESAQIQH